VFCWSSQQYPGLTDANSSTASASLHAMRKLVEEMAKLENWERIEKRLKNN